MGVYRKKPVEIEAALFDGELVGVPMGNARVIPGTCPDWFPAVTREITDEAEVLKLRENEVVVMGGTLWIGTLEGAHRASPGDWIIRGVKGELYPCKPDIFLATYDGPF